MERSQTYPLAQALLDSIGPRLTGSPAWWLPRANPSDSGRLEVADLPIRQTRIIEFSTDEGTNLSLDVSPDGRTLIFDLLGDLYTMPIAGGKATRLTHGLAWDATPRFSPDGRLIAYTSDRSGTIQLWVIRPDGTGARRITRAITIDVEQPLWTPDSRALLARINRPSRPVHQGLHEDQIELWRYDVTTGAGTELVTDDAYTTGGVASSDGQKIYYATDQSLAVRDLKSGRTETLPGSGEHAGAPLISSDGRWLLYAAGSAEYGEPTNLRLRNLATGEDSVLVTNGQAQTRSHSRGYTFTPDARAAVFVREGKLHRIELSNRRITAIPFVAPVRAEFGPRVERKARLDDGPFAVRQLRSVHLSPDGSQLVFSALGKIWLSPVGGTPRRLTRSAQREYEPVFSPDGKWIAFVTWSDTAGGHLWKVLVAGGDAVQLTREPGVYSTPRWTSDGARIVLQEGQESSFGWVTVPPWTPTSDSSALAKDWYTSYMRPNARIVSVDAAGGSLRQIGPPFSRRMIEHSGPALSLDPASTRAYYVDKDTAAENLWLLQSVGLETGDVRTHVRIEAGVGGVIAAPSPDGRWLAIQDKFNVLLLPFPAAGQVDSVPTIRLAGFPSQRSRGIIRVTTEGGMAPSWSPDGQWLHWQWTNHALRVPISEAARGVIKPRKIAIHLEAPRHQASGTLLLRGARIIPMSARRASQPSVTVASSVSIEPAVIEHGDLLLTGRRIVAVGPTGSLRVPSGATILDVAGATIIPGLIDMHGHWGYSSYLQPDRMWWLASGLAYGVTTTRDPAMGYSSFAEAELVEAGDAIGPRHFGALAPIEPAREEIFSFADADEVVRKHHTAGSWVIKQYTQPHRLQRQWLAQAARRSGVNATNEGGGGLAMNLSMVLDGYTGFEHNLSRGRLYRDVLELLGRADVNLNNSGKGILTNTRLTDWNRRLHFWPPAFFQRAQKALRREDISAQLRTERDALRAGANVMLGTDAGLAPFGLDQHGYIWNWVAQGMTPAEALRVATRNGAHGLGLEADLGSLEPGKIADLVVLNGNPLDDIHHTANIKFVVKDGVVYDAETLDTVWPTAKKFAGLPWWNSKLKSRPRD
jgi:Tol biopolymer transport system component